MLWPARGAAPLLLAALLLQLVTPGALAPSLPQPSAADWLAQGAGDRGQAADLPAAAASASEQQRRLAAADASLPRQPHPHKPLPNFAIGVPAPPAKQLGPWQQGAARERAQEMSSADFLAEDYPVLGYVALCLVARDAHADLLEWLNHHLRLGVSKVYLWDHESSPPMRDVVQGYIDAGLVEYNSMPSALAAAHPSGKPQLAAYDACLQRWGPQHTWMGFIDVDEFLMFRDPWPPIQSLPLFLQSFEGPGLPPDAHPAIGVHWILFGSSGHVTRPTRGALRSYTRCLQLRHGQHALVKSIVRTACTVSAEGPHNFKHNCTRPALQTNGSPMSGPRSEEPVHKRLALHHYATRSRSEFEVKMRRGSAMKRQRGWEYFDFIDEWATEFCFDGLTVWDSQTSFRHYPGVTEEALARYEAEQHEDFWLKGTNDPRYKEQQQAQAGQQAQQQQQQTAAQAVDAAGAAAAAAAGVGAAGAAGQQADGLAAAQSATAAAADGAAQQAQQAQQQEEQQQQQQAVPLDQEAQEQQEVLQQVRRFHEAQQRAAELSELSAQEGRRQADSVA